MSLSEKIIDRASAFNPKQRILIKKDVKQFIKETETDMRNWKLSRMGVVERFRERVGKELI